MTVGRLRFHARLLALYFAQYAKARLDYRADFATAVLASFLGTAASFSVVLLLFSRFPHLAGWSFPEIVFLYGFSLLPYGLFSVLSLNLYEFADRYLVEGRFDRILLRPVSPLFQIVFESFRLESLQEVVTGTVATIDCPETSRTAAPAKKILIQDVHPEMDFCLYRPFVVPT